LHYRTNNALTQTIGVNARNERTTITRARTYTVAGTTAPGGGYVPSRARGRVHQRGLSGR
jgi:hypothetical protein